MSKFRTWRVGKYCFPSSDARFFEKTGLRNRSFFSGADIMPRVKFVKEKKEIEVPDGACLRDVALKAGLSLNLGVNGIGASINRNFNCGGKGLCGTCAVLIVKGMENTNPLTKREKLRLKCPIPDPIPTLAYIGHEDTMRLSCMTKIHGDIEVESGPEFNLFGENFFS